MNVKSQDDAQLQGWMAKLNTIGKTESDLSQDEDLAIGLMNLVSLEEHFYFTAMKTNKQQYLDMLAAVRTVRQKFLKKIVIDPQGEEWCISKHLLAASMRLMEVGTKEYGKNKVEATAYFEASYELFSLFFALNLKVIDSQDLPTATNSNSQIVTNKFSQIMTKLINCCKEW